MARVTSALDVDVTAEVTLSTSAWTHIAVVRNDTTFTLYVNGVSVGTDTDVNPVGDYTGAFEIGRQTQLSTQYWYGWIDEFRVSKGIARWTADFTAPTAGYNYLNGNTDVLYELRTRVVSGTASNSNASAWLNSDTTTSSITGYQYVSGTNTNVAAGRSTTTDGAWIQMGYHTGLGEMSMGKALIYAKSGYPRVSLTERTDEMSTTTVTGVFLQAHSWNNTTDNITSILLQTAASGLGIGTHIELWRLNL
jgi:hypothetical protein